MKMNMISNNCRYTQERHGSTRSHDLDIQLCQISNWIVYDISDWLLRDVHGSSKKKKCDGVKMIDPRFSSFCVLIMIFLSSYVAT